MCRNAIAVLTIALVIAGCSSAGKQQAIAEQQRAIAKSFVQIQVVELKDATDPLLLTSTDAARVSEYLEMGLKNRGYSVCRVCRSDAVATVSVSEYGTKQVTKRNWLGWLELNTFNVSISRWVVTITRDGKTLLDESYSDEETEPLVQLVVRQVRELLKQIPERK